MAEETTQTHHIRCALLRQDGSFTCTCGAYTDWRDHTNAHHLPICNKWQPGEFGAEDPEIDPNRLCTCMPRHPHHDPKIRAKVGGPDANHSYTVVRPVAQTDPEPQPSDGPDYHAEHAAWQERLIKVVNTHDPRAWHELAPGCCMEVKSSKVDIPLGYDNLTEHHGVEPPEPETLPEWWVRKAQAEIDAIMPKATEYGGQHRASDLIELGASQAQLMGHTGDPAGGNFTDGYLQELAVYFYLRGKMGRWHAALLEGRRVSDDTVHDIKIYATMVQRIREAGGWPV